MDDGAQRLEVALAPKQPFSRRELVGHDPHGKKIASLVLSDALDSLRSHIGVLPLEHPCLGPIRADRCLGHSEIDELHHSRGVEQQILGGNVPVDDVQRSARFVAQRVSISQPDANLP